MPAKGIQGDLLHFLSDYLQGRTLQVIINGQTSQAKPMQASVPLGPLLWNLYVDDLLQLVTEIAAYADDCTFPHSFKRKDGYLVAAEFSQKLNLINEWRKRRQVNFAHGKT